MGRALLDTDVDALAAHVAAIENDLTSFWLMFGAILVFFMQSGFALLEAGTVRAKNAKNILLKNVVDACLGAIVWWLWGHAFAYGSGGSDESFIGGDGYAALDDGVEAARGGSVSYYSTWLFQWAFAATAATIVSGAVAERCKFTAYLIYTTVLTGFIYPVVVHWGWSGEGFLSAFHASDDYGGDYDPFIGGQGLIDFAGSGIVHMVGGGSALMGAYFIGPRIGRFDANGKCVDMPGHSMVLASLGTFILWVGWYGFNPVSTLCLSGCMAVASKVAVTTTVAAAAGGLSYLTTYAAINKHTDLAPALNGILGGLVSITAPCPVVEPWAAALIGAIGGLVCYGSSSLLKKLKIDDPLDASPVHFFCGMWGVFSVGLFATKFNTVANAYGQSSEDYGVFYGGPGLQLGIQCIGILVIAAWTLVTSGLMFFTLSKLKMLRVPADEEGLGLDESHHGGSAYNSNK